MSLVSAKDLQTLLSSQRQEWPMAASNFKGLEEVQSKTLNIGQAKVRVQFNPKRIISSGAKVDEKTIAERPCFLCEKNRPQEQKSILFGGYEILINPFPIFPEHFTIPAISHTPQLIEGRIGDLLELAYQLTPYVLFYNGPFCGASAPDHMHFQAGNSRFLPIEEAAKEQGQQDVIIKKERGIVFRIKDFPCQTLVIKSASKEFCQENFEKILTFLPIHEGHEEPMMNILSFFHEGEWFLLIIPRKKHRPSCFFAEGNQKITISPASVDLGGVFITPLKKDFDRANEKLITEIYNEVCLDQEEMNYLINHIQL